MKRKLPPLNALRVFEAAGRHLSFTVAAAELHLTQGAVSRQVRTLEDFLGKDLFQRFPRRVELTAEGRALMLSAERAFADIETTLERLRNDNLRVALSVSILPTLASLWLMPRLSAFGQTHKGVEVRILASIEPAPLGRGTVDLAIACGALPGKRYEKLQPRIELQMVDDWKGVHAQPLFPDRLVPVLSKRLAGHIAPIKQIGDLRSHRLIHTATRSTAWPDWLRANGASWRTSAEDIGFGHFFMALQAAREGKGIAIVPKVLLNLYEGRDELATPFEANIASAGEYFLLTRERSEDDPYVEILRRWILDQANSLALLA